MLTVKITHGAFGNWSTCFVYFCYNRRSTNFWILSNLGSMCLHRPDIFSRCLLCGMSWTAFVMQCRSVTDCTVEHGLPTIFEITRNDLLSLWILIILFLYFLSIVSFPFRPICLLAWISFRTGIRFCRLLVTFIFAKRKKRSVQILDKKPRHFKTSRH